MESGTVEKFRLRYETGAVDIRPCVSLVFGKLLELASPFIKAYQSDLYHDAIWLHDNLAGESFVFYWSCNESGTTIGHTGLAMRAQAYRLAVRCEDGATSLEVETLSS